MSPEFLLIQHESGSIVMRREDFSSAYEKDGATMVHAVGTMAPFKCLTPVRDIYNQLVGQELSPEQARRPGRNEYLRGQLYAFSLKTGITAFCPSCGMWSKGGREGQRCRDGAGGNPTCLGSWVEISG